MSDITIGTASTNAGRTVGPVGRAPRRAGPEAANAITHGLGSLLAIAALVILVIAAAATGDPWKVVAYAVFGAAMVFLYTASTLYHALSFGKHTPIFEVLDHSAIFVLIAGTYTSFALTILRPTSGWWLFGAVWAIAVVGIVLESLFLNRKPLVSLIAYLAMGWLIVAVWKDFVTAAPAATVTFLIAGGLAYTVGTLFYAIGKRKPWFHPVWHLFVLAGTACHFFAALAALPALAA